MRNKVVRAIREYGMLYRGDTVIAALSGGADSMAMTHILARLQEPLGITLRACHVNHGLRGAEAIRDEEFVRAWCQKEHIPLTVYSVRVREEALPGESVETAARRCRYACLARCRGQYGGKIATAHTLSDSIETVFFHLMRGTGIKGLGGIPPVREEIIRPLILCTRQEVEAYCQEEGIPFVTDSTNLEDEYVRNRIRHRLIPIAEEIDPRMEKTLPRLMETAREDSLCLSELAKSTMEEAKTGRGYRIDVILSRPVAIRRRCAVRLLEENGFAVSFERTGEILSMLEKRHGRVEYQRGRYLAVRDGLVFPEERQEEEPYFSVPLQEGCTSVQAAGKTLHLRRMNCEQFKNSEKDFGIDLKNLLDYDRIKGLTEVRRKKPGDAISLAGRNGTKTLKKLFNERKIPPAQRSRVLVLCDREGPVWVEGLGAAARTAADGMTQRFLSLTVEDASSGGMEKGTSEK